MKKICIVVLAVAFLAPSIALAATYQYVDVMGNVKSVEAMSAEQALMMPTDRDPQSGVMLVRNMAISPAVKVVNP